MAVTAFVARAQESPSDASAAKVPAFPGAEGYGSMTIGGRGGKVIAVTNLNDAGPGSLREACASKGPRIVVFRVSGTIVLKSPLKISNPYITIAGQTAPGDGICLKDYPLSIDASEVIVRYLRVRMGQASGNDNDTVGGRGQKNVIVDHVSASWSIDETMSIYHCENLTVQWCMITESLYNAGHACNRSIVIATEGKSCPRCGRVVHCGCEPSATCSAWARELRDNTVLEFTTERLLFEASLQINGADDLVQELFGRVKSRNIQPTVKQATDLLYLCQRAAGAAELLRSQAETRAKVLCPGTKRVRLC